MSPLLVMPTTLQQQCIPSFDRETGEGVTAWVNTSKKAGDVRLEGIAPLSAIPHCGAFERRLTAVGAAGSARGR